MAQKKYRIGEVASMLDLRTSVLRFWESEFPGLEPVRTPKGQRLYTEDNVELLRRIQYLLHDKGMTIDGARRVLNGLSEEPGDTGVSAAAAADDGFWDGAVGELRSIRDLLAGESEA